MNAPLRAHSIVEIQLYLKVAACERCGKGPFRCDDPVDLGSLHSPATLALACTVCGATIRQSIEVVSPTDNVASAAINPTSEPSNLIDLGQWLVLVSLLAEEAGRETDRARARELGMSAAQCLDEALKFYTDAENDLPPPEAFFHEASRERFRDSPQHFSRQRIAGMKSNLPRPYTGQ